MRLTEALDTIYIGEYYLKDVEEILATTKELDIAGARLTPAISRALTSAMGSGVLIYDSEDHEREAILLENRTRRNLQLPTEKLPILTNHKELASYLKELKEGVLYELEGDNSLIIPLVTLILFYRPEIQIAVDNRVKPLLAYIMENLYRFSFEEIISSTNEFLAVIDEDTRKITIEANNRKEKFHVYGVGNTDWDDFASRYLVIPAYFGKVKVNRDPELKELWKPVSEKALQHLTKYLSYKEQTIKNFLEGR